MRAFELLANSPTPDALPSSRSRSLMLSAVAKHESRLRSLRERAAAALEEGEANLQAALKELPVLVNETLSAATHGASVELDETAASFEDSLIGACVAPTADEARDIVGGLAPAVRQRQRQLPLSLSSAMETCVAAAEATMHTASNAADAAVVAAATAITEGCASVQAALERDMSVAREALSDEVMRAAQMRGGAQGLHDSRWGSMWGRLDEMINQVRRVTTV